MAEQILEGIVKEQTLLRDKKFWRAMKGTLKECT